MEVSTIMEIIQNQMLEIMQDDLEYYKKYNIILSNEQQFIKNKDRTPNSIYIVVKFAPSSLNYGQFVQSITVTALAEQNKFDVCQRLLLEYVSRYHLSEPIYVGDDIIKQTYTTPAVMSNFNEMDYGYRTLMHFSGVFLVGENSNPLIKISWENELGELEEIPFLTSHWNWNTQLDSQGFYSTNGRTTSEARTGTFVLGFSIFQTSSDFCTKILEMVFDNSLGVNQTFTFTLQFKNGISRQMDLKCVQVENNQNIGEFPSIVLSFTR